jgi:hypothetical protein
VKPALTKTWETTFDHCGVQIKLSLAFVCAKVEGEAWTHIRKQQKVAAYNFDPLIVSFAGTMLFG